MVEDGGKGVEMVFGVVVDEGEGEGTVVAGFTSSVICSTLCDVLTTTSSLAIGKGASESESDLGVGDVG